MTEALVDISPTEIVLDIPTPPSVNVTRRHNSVGWAKLEQWKVAADKALMASGQYRAARRGPPLGAFEIEITLDVTCRLDLDNPIKSAIDYLRRIELIRDDSQKYLRKLTVTWGYAPAGARIVLREART